MMNISSLFEFDDSYVAYKYLDHRSVRAIDGYGFSLSYLLYNRRELINSSLGFWECPEKGTSMGRGWDDDELVISIPNTKYSDDVESSLSSIISSLLYPDERVVQIDDKPSKNNLTFSLIILPYV